MNKSKLILAGLLSIGFTFGAANTAFAEEAVEATIMKTTDPVNFRENPSMGGLIIQIVPMDAEVKVIEKEEEWAKVVYAEKIGYIRNDLLLSAQEEEVEEEPAKTVELLSWGDVKNSIVTVDTPMEVYDVYTGLTYYVKSFSNGLHADVEPITTDDTWIMKETFGGVWKWDPRPVWVTVNGRTIAASINGMPHGGGVNNSNGMNGQICIHFQGSTTHNGNWSFANWHQEVLVEAYNLSL